MLTLQALMKHPGKGAELDCIIQLSCGKVQIMKQQEVMKQPEHGRTSTTEEQK